MSNPGSLNQVLRSLDGTAPSIQNAAAAMMKHYDQASVVAVTEWRNVLSTSSHPQHLMSLLYVANEVLQVSKRNRGPKFLEAFSTVLGQALQHICRQDPSLTEKVRRTVKIWGDRRVFSTRFVGELLQGLDSFRKGAAAPPAPAPAPRREAPAVSSTKSNLPSANPTFRDDDDGATFSPTASVTSPASNKTTVTAPSDDDEEENIMNILEAEENAKNSGSEDDDGDDGDDEIFGADAQLKVDILEVAQDAGDRSSKPSKAKRRRSSASTGSVGKQRRRNSSVTTKTTMSTNGLLELSNKVTELQDEYDESVLSLQRIDNNLAKTTPEELEQIVGDELQVEYRQILRYQEQMIAERKRLYEIAQARKGLEQEALTYLPWLEKALERDQEEIAFCDRLEKDLGAFLPVHAELKKTRDIRRAQEKKRMEEEAERERARREKEEAERFRQESLSRQTEQSDGMVWNPATREYVTLNTEESWRD